ncbi:MAG: PRK06851 family protein [Peptococcaceae bacterium]|nr:PRK06851 family protein [Peptococcaceae bacterium]
MSQGSIRKFFPGANTSRGFYSLYKYIIPQDTTRIFIVKGGPGVGKSTFMKKICQSFTEQGYDAEWHCCSSDNGSIDGLVLAQIGVALIDGTAPHIVDPKNPGAVDEIIHLGDYWDESVLRLHKEEILTVNARVGRLFGLAYFALAEAQAAMNEWKSYATEAQNWGRVNQRFVSMWQEVVSTGGFTGQWDVPPVDRHLFAWAVSPQGKCNYIDTLLPGIGRLYLLNGAPGSGKSDFLNNFGQRAMELGFDVEFYHNSLNPEELDGVIVRTLGTAMFSGSDPFAYVPQGFNGEIIQVDLAASLDKHVLNLYANEVAAAAQRFAGSMERAIAFIAKAKAEHDTMETYYVKAMDFAAIEQRRQAIEQRIRGYAAELTRAATANADKRI